MEDSKRDIFHLAFQALPEALVLVDANGSVLAVNRAFENLTGRNLESLREFDISTLCITPGEDGYSLGSLDYWTGPMAWEDLDGNERLFYCTLKSVAQTDDLSAKDSPQAYLLSVRAVLGEEKTIGVGSTIPRERLESLGILAGSIAHDLNNVLTGVLGHVSYMRVSSSGVHANRESLIAIEDGARNAASMTQRVLEFARGQAVELRSVNFSRVVSAAINLFRAALPKNIVLEVEGNDKELFVRGDESGLSQLVMNLAANARDALPDGGKISLKLERVSFEDLGASLHCGHGSGDYAKLTIRDNGLGISPDVRDHIFEPFFTTKSRVGTGLGLATVFSIIEEHCGFITVESEEAKGATFEVFIPVWASEPSVREEQKGNFEEETVPGGSERILIVDDEEAVRMIIQRTLEHLGYVVEVAENGQEAVDIFEKNPIFDLVIIDMIMPKMSGDEVFSSLRKIDESVAVLIASGYSSDSRTKAVLESGGLGFIQKPFAMEELAQEVRRCLDLARKKSGEAGSGPDGDANL